METPEQEHRIYVHRLVCTYMNISDLKFSVEGNEDLNQLKKSFYLKLRKIKYYVIARDRTKEGEVHYHIYLEFEKRKQISVKIY
jgi:hypothetical protein